MRAYIIFGGLFVAMAVQAGDRSFEPIAGEGQEIRYSNGEGRVISHGARSSIVAALASEGRNRLRFTLYLANEGEDVVDFSPDNVRASYRGESLAVVPAEQLIKEAGRASSWKRALVGLAGGISAGTAGAHAGRTRYSGTVSTRSPYGLSTESTYHGTVEDPAAAEEAKERALDRMNDSLGAINHGTAVEVATIEANTLRRNTLEPGQKVFGDIIFDGQITDDSDIAVVVQARNDVHILWFNRTAAGARQSVAHAAAAQMPPTQSPDVNQAERARARALAELTRRHPDWREIDASDTFRAWFLHASPEMQALARSSDPNEVSQALTAYKNDLKVSAMFRIKE